MAAEHEDHEDQAPEHGQPPAGGKPRGKLAALMAGKHRDQIIIVTSVVSVLLLWLTFRRTTTAAGNGGGAMTSQLGPTQAAQQGMMTGSVAGSDANALLGFQTLLANQSDQIQQINQALSGVLAGSTPDNTPSALSSPIAAGLLQPNYTGNYFHMGSGIGEIESDGSLFTFTQPQWAQASKINPGTLTDFGNQNLPGVPAYSTAYNVQAKAKSTASPA